MATQIHGAGPAGQRSPGLDLAIAGYLAENDVAGGGVELVSGTVTLDGTGSPVREFYATATATINGVAFAAGTAVVWRRTPAGVWGYIVVEPWTDISATTTTTTTAATTTTTTTAATTTTTTTAATEFPATLAGLFAWWDASDTSTIIPGASMYWNDKSGNGNNLIQTDVAKQPSTGTRSLNGLNVLDFGSGDYLTKALSPAVDQPVTVATVLVLDSTPASNQVAVSFQNFWAAYARSTGVWSMYAPTYLDSAVSTDTAAHVHVNVFNGASSLIRLDGTQIASGNAGTNNMTGAIIGAASTTGSASIDGAIAEVIVVQGVLSGTDLTDLESYLSAKWGTP